MPSKYLTDRSVLSVSGTDGEHFLQNLVTCDVEGLPADDTTFGALLTPQGKILFEFFITRGADGFLLDTVATYAADLQRRLTFYKLRADVRIDTTDLPVSVSWDAGEEDAGVKGTDPRLAGFATRRFTADGGSDDYHAHRIAHGLPVLGHDFQPETTFPHEALYDQLAQGGVDFQKGCYVGQEVVSRMQHRGTARSRFVIVSGASLPPAGTPVQANGRSIGTMGSSQGEQGLALVRLDRAAKAMAGGTAISAGEADISLHLPPFATFGWPDAGNG